MRADTEKHRGLLSFIQVCGDKLDSDLQLFATSDDMIQGCWMRYCLRQVKSTNLKSRLHLHLRQCSVYSNVRRKLPCQSERRSIIQISWRLCCHMNWATCFSRIHWKPGPRVIFMTSSEPYPPIVSCTSQTTLIVLPEFPSRQLFG